MKLLRRVLFVLVLQFLIVSCLKDTNSHTVITAFITMKADELPDTVNVLTPISVSMESKLNNTCWHSLQFMDKRVNDTTYAFAVIATFENEGEYCDTITQVYDTTYTIVPVKAKPHLFMFYSCDTLMRTDTVIVLPASK